MWELLIDMMCTRRIEIARSVTLRIGDSGKDRKSQICFQDRERPSRRVETPQSGVKIILKCEGGSKLLHLASLSIFNYSLICFQYHLAFITSGRSQSWLYQIFHFC